MDFDLDGLLGGFDARNNFGGDNVTLIVFCILAILGGLAIYFLFASPKNEGKFTGFVGWLYEFARFRESIAATLLKVTYFIFAIFATLQGLYLLFVSFGTGILWLIVGNLALRVVYELILVLLSIHENLVAIRKRIAPEEQPETIEKTEAAILEDKADE